MRKLRMFTHQMQRERGSALLVSLMVMVGLSLLGLGFVAITETESSIAVNERNSAQAQFAAETGAKMVMDMFQDTQWMDDRDLLPDNINAFKTRRVFNTPGNDGYYKSNATWKLFDRPFKGANPADKFFGDVDVTPTTADVWIYYGKNAQSDAYLDKLNAALFMPDTAHNEQVRISDIRVGAPPIPGDELNANNFWEGSVTRYGVATIKITAQKMAGTRILAERAVKAILAETPFPTVDGAIETSGTLVGQGSFEVYWGKVLSEKGIELKRAVSGMPWFDAKNMMNFEYGYDSARPRLDATNYAPGAVVMAPAAAQLADPQLMKFSYKATQGAVAASAPAGTAPALNAWPKAIGDTLVDGGVTWEAIAAVSFPIDADFYHSADWYYAMIGRNIPDPWLHARARQEILAGTGKASPCGQAAAFHPCDYNAPGLDVQARFSNLFQFQTTTDPGDRPDRVEAVFPTMDYEFWKNVALSGNNENGVYYFKYAGPATATHNNFIGPGGQVRSIYAWLNAMDNGLGAGFYFFDTKNSKSPQFNKGGIMTPSIKINSGAVTSPFQMQGYIYLNAEWFGTTGAGNLPPDDLFPMPGEPFRDVGIREVDDTVTPLKYRVMNGTVPGTLPTDDYSWTGRNNGVWDFQDVNANVMFDLFLSKRTVTRPDGSTATDVWLPVPFFEGCTPGDNSGAIPGANCSEPHEPYLNISYTPSFGGKNPTGGVTFEWYDPATSGAGITDYRMPKLRTGINTTVTCTATSSNDHCTSNSYDQDGALAEIAALLWGAMYNEGGYDGSGNAIYYGALLMRAAFNATGTPTVYFNECLARGCLEEQLKLQRVTATSWQTD